MAVDKAITFAQSIKNRHVDEGDPAHPSQHARAFQAERDARHRRIVLAQGPKITRRRRTAYPAHPKLDPDEIRRGAFGMTTANEDFAAERNEERRQQREVKILEKELVDWGTSGDVLLARYEEHTDDETGADWEALLQEFSAAVQWCRARYAEVKKKSALRATRVRGR